MLKNYTIYEKHRHIFWITVVYLLSQWFLLIVTGRWWDDWVYADKNWEYLYEVMRQSSVPFIAYLDASLWRLPDGFYRVITFALYYAGAILFYFILRRTNIFQDEECFWIALLYVTVPVNDARITWICFPYGVGFLLMWIAFFLTTIWTEKTGAVRVLLRIGTLLILTLAFSCLQSTMMMVIPIVGYLCYKELRTNGKLKDAKTIVRNLFASVIHYLDILILPVIWKFGTQWLYPGYGIYGGVYYIGWSKLPSILMNFPQTAYRTFVGILSSYLSILKSSHFLIVAIAFVIIICVITKNIYIRNKTDDENYDKSLKRNIILMITGAIVFLVALFPYAVIRNSVINNIGTRGRDSILLGIGTAVFLYYGLNLILKQKISQIIAISLIVAGVVHFNFMYLDWQESYYQQIQLQHGFADNKEIEDNDTFLVMSKGGIISTCFYQTNGNSWVVFGNQKRFYMDGIKDLKILFKESEHTRWYLNAYMMNEYNYGERIIDGIIFVDYPNIDRKTIFKQKLNECFDKSSFNIWLDEIKNIKYVPITKNESNKIKRLYLNRKLKEPLIYDLFYR